MSWSESPSTRARITAAASSGTTLRKTPAAVPRATLAARNRRARAYACRFSRARSGSWKRLAPELDEHRPEIPALRGHLETRAEQGAQVPAGVADAAGLRRHAAVEVGHDGRGRAAEDGALVPEVVVEDSGAHAGLRRDPLHREAGVTVARQAADRRADDRRPALGGDLRDAGSSGLAAEPRPRRAPSGRRTRLPVPRHRAWPPRHAGSTCRHRYIGWSTNLSLSRILTGRARAVNLLRGVRDLGPRGRRARLYWSP